LSLPRRSARNDDLPFGLPEDFDYGNIRTVDDASGFRASAVTIL
jgi:hypothetical protein